MQNATMAPLAGHRLLPVKQFPVASRLLPAVVYQLMPLVAQAACQGNEQLFSYRWAFVDKSVFRVKGGGWHRIHRLLGIVPHSSIDTDASWSKSAYHSCRFGYGLHLLCNQHCFSLACTVTRAATKDTTQLIPLLVHFAQHLGEVVADAGYVALAVLKPLLDCWKVFISLAASKLLICLPGRKSIIC